MHSNTTTMARKQLHSVGGIVYYIADDGQPRYLIIKRHARSKKIERVAPKGKIEANESEEQTCIREIGEEAGIQSMYLTIGKKLWEVQIKNINFWQWFNEKEVTYYLVKYSGKPENVKIQLVEGFLGIHKRATIQEITWLILYPSMRDIFYLWHQYITTT